MTVVRRGEGGQRKNEFFNGQAVADPPSSIRSPKRRPQDDLNHARACKLGAPRASSRPQKHKHLLEFSPALFDRFEDLRALLRHLDQHQRPLRCLKRQATQNTTRAGGGRGCRACGLDGTRRTSPRTKTGSQRLDLFQVRVKAESFTNSWAAAPRLCRHFLKLILTGCEPLAAKRDSIPEPLP